MRFRFQFPVLLRLTSTQEAMCSAGLKPGCAVCSAWCVAHAGFALVLGLQPQTAELHLFSQALESAAFSTL